MEKLIKGGRCVEGVDLDTVLWYTGNMNLEEVHKRLARESPKMANAFPPTTAGLTRLRTRLAKIHRLLKDEGQLRRDGVRLVLDENGYRTLLRYIEIIAEGESLDRAIIALKKELGKDDAIELSKDVRSWIEHKLAAALAKEAKERRQEDKNLAERIEILEQGSSWWGRFMKALKRGDE